MDNRVLSVVTCRTMRVGTRKRAYWSPGLGWPEGPSVLPDGRVAFVEAYLGRISSFHPKRGLETLALVGGGPNATTLGSDGKLYVTQTGGIVGPWRSQDARPASIQSVTASGKVEIIATALGGVQFQAPNDLAFGPDGNLYFTDPGRFDLETKPDPGYLFVLRPDGSGDVLEELPPTYPNGIAVLGDNSVVWVESYTRRVKRRHPNGKIELLHEFDDPSCIPDGFAVTRDGNLVIATCASGLACVLSPSWPTDRRDRRRQGSHQLRFRWQPSLRYRRRASWQHHRAGARRMSLDRRDRAPRRIPLHTGAIR